jgi:hypothetical protein
MGRYKHHNFCWSTAEARSAAEEVLPFAGLAPGEHAYRLRHLEGHEMAREALRVWIQRDGSQPSTLLQIAERFPKARTSLRNDLEVLL